jgi:hypothetical protein
MTFRIRHSDDGSLGFEGLLDPAALELLRRRVVRGTRVVLRRGSAVEPGCWDGLRALGVELEAESVYLARLLRDGRT